MEFAARRLQNSTGGQRGRFKLNYGNLRSPRGPFPFTMAWRQQRQLEELFRGLQNQVWGGGAGWGGGRPSWGGGAKATGGKGRKDGGKGNVGVNTAAGVPADPCKCCGKRNHYKKECRFRDKECNTCGLTGHLAAVCWGGKGKPDIQTNMTKPSPTSPNAPKTAVAD